MYGYLAIRLKFLKAIRVIQKEYRMVFSLIEEDILQICFASQMIRQDLYAFHSPTGFKIAAKDFLSTILSICVVVL